MYIKRKIYQQLLNWKNDSSHSTLEVIGTRHLGKTYIINRFTDEHFKHKIYVNLEETSGAKFLDCYQRAIHWIPGTPRPKDPLQDAFRLFDTSFRDCDDTVIILDEIQAFPTIYNRIREFTREFQAHFIITSSIPLQMFSQEYHFSCGDVTSISIYPLSFEEFLHSLDQNELSWFRLLFTIYRRSLCTLCGTQAPSTTLNNASFIMAFLIIFLIEIIFCNIHLYNAVCKE